MERTCTQCSAVFEVTERDRKFLKKVSPVFGMTRYSFPEPEQCSVCREQRRASQRNETNIFKRKCDATGNDILSLYPPGHTCTVYEDVYWNSDSWDPMDYGRDYHEDESFFEQFHELLMSIPRRAMHRDTASVNSDYTTFGLNNRNCYMCCGCIEAEDCMHCHSVIQSKNCIDCLLSTGNEMLYQCIGCDDCYSLNYSLDCLNCKDSWFLHNCHDCTNCIGCKNLRHKEYHILNAPVTKEQFEAVQANLQTFTGLQRFKEKFTEWQRTIPTMYSHKHNTEDCSGHYLENCQSCHNCFDIILGAQDCTHCQMCGWGGTDMMDCSRCGMQASSLYECMSVAGSQKVFFSISVNGSSDIYYCDQMRGCEYCFGCAGLTNKSYCIFNKQYSKEEYEALLPVIIAKMVLDGEWGRWPGVEHNIFAYNLSVAFEELPMEKNAALQRGWQWHDYQKSAPTSDKVIPADQLPERITDVPDDVLNWAIECSATGRLFKIIKKELAFYRQQNITLPRLHPDERQLHLRNQRNAHFLHSRPCDKCQAIVKSSYASEYPGLIYCEECYLKEVY